MPPVIKQKAKKSPKKADKNAAKEEVVSGQLQKKINKKQPAKASRGVVFIKHLPHGFFEQQLKNYFQQFGKVTRLRLARSRSTGGSKGYAFVEFEYPEVAQVAAETMHNYLMFKKIVKAAYIPPEKQQYNYFKSTVRTVKNKSGKTVWVSSKTASLQRKMKQHNEWTDENFQKRTSKQLKKLRKLGEKCGHLGIDIDEIIYGGSSTTTDVATDDKAASSSKGKKRKVVKEVKEDKKSKKQPKLEDLLGNTLPEDSDDDSFIAVQGEDAESDEEDPSSDEESYGFLKDADEEDESEDEDDDVDEEEEDVSDDPEEVQLPVKKSKTKFSKSLKASNIERFDQMLKRKPHAGGVQKANKKPIKQPVAFMPKNKMQLSAAKELAKPLNKIKGKETKNFNSKAKKSKKVK